MCTYSSFGSRHLSIREEQAGKCGPSTEIDMVFRHRHGKISCSVYSCFWPVTEERLGELFMVIG